MLMHNKKSLTERVSERFSEIKKVYSPKLRNAIFNAEVRFAYLQESLKGIVPKVNKKNIRNIAFNLFTIPTLAITYSVSALASEQTNLEEYIEQNQYDLSTILQLRLKSLNENGLDDFEKEFIDLLQGLPKDIQKVYAKEVYDKGFTTELLEKLKKVEAVEKPVEILEDKIIKEPENPVDIYAVIANGADDETDDGKFFGGGITSALEFYKLMKDVGVSDDNITLFLYHPNTEDIINTLTKKWIDYNFGPTPLPFSKSNVIIDEEKVTLNKVLDAISAIPSDDNDLVYIMLSSHVNPEYTIRFPNGRLGYKSLSKAIKKIDDYGKIFVILDSCYAGGFLKPLKKLKNYVGIGSCPKEEKCIPGILSFMLVKHKDKSIDDLVEFGNTEIENSKKDKATLVVFYSDESFGNEPLIP